MLDSWNDGPTKTVIVEFVEHAVKNIETASRVAVFDNDGTLWCEKPAYIQLAFPIRRLAEQAADDPSLRRRQPYRAAAAGDLQWFGDAVTKHYQGDDGDLKVLGAAVLSANAAISTEEHAARVQAFFAEARHPTLGRPYTACGYAPMIELLRYLEANGFACYIASGGGRDFMRPVTGRMYGIPPERVIGSSVGLIYRDGDLFTTEQPEFLDDGPVKPVRIWGRTGRRPIFAAGNSNGDIEMLEYTRGCRWWCCTTTLCANSITWQERRRLWRWPEPEAGPSSACATTGRMSSPVEDSAPDLGANMRGCPHSRMGTNRTAQRLSGTGLTLED